MMTFQRTYTCMKLQENLGNRRSVVRTYKLGCKFSYLIIETEHIVLERHLLIRISNKINYNSEKKD